MEVVMKNILAALVAATSLAAVSLAAQAPQTPSTGAAAAGASWTVPRTPDGQPDLQGVWRNNSMTPLERPAEWEGKETLTDAELAELQAAVGTVIANGGDAVFGDGLIRAAINQVAKPTSGDGKTGNYNHFWLVDRDWDNRTAQTISPKNGRQPALTPAAQARRGAGRERAESSEGGPRGRADSHEDRPLGERCVHFAQPRLGAAYNSYLQIVQSPEYVVIYQEMAHDSRIVPLDGRPHLPSDVRQWGGSSRGRFEGNTLVVETKNYSSKAPFGGMTANGRVIERFTRTAPDVIEYEVTLDDPDTWVEPWVRMIRLRASEEPVYEYACHEGNYAMEGILAGFRAEEKEAAEAKSSTK
jgi:hypothetical protein